MFRLHLRLQLVLVRRDSTKMLKSQNLKNESKNWKETLANSDPTENRQIEKMTDDMHAHVYFHVTGYRHESETREHLKKRNPVCQRDCMELSNWRCCIAIYPHVYFQKPRHATMIRRTRTLRGICTKHPTEVTSARPANQLASICNCPFQSHDCLCVWIWTQRD